MKRNISVLLTVILLLSVLASVPAGAGAAEDAIRAEIYGEESAGTSVDADIFSPMSGVGEDDAPAAPTVQDKPALAATGVEKTVTDYTYEITPLLAPFNAFFFVKTDNPDPRSFRFLDSESVYFEKEDETDNIGAYMDYSDELVLFSDVKYENESTGRVAGGYIFKCDHYNTDGGKLTLQYKTGHGWWDEEWFDTQITCTVPKVKDNVDYLIDTFATKGSFFENMDAVQSGFESICFYSGSYIRGVVKRKDPYWMLARAGHYDQSYYIYSPFDREDNRSLFASAIYPFRYDSLGFPGMMAAVSQRLDSTSTYEWTENHWLVNITLDGVTKSYGGAGNIEGQGIDEKDIRRVFTFTKDDEPITLENSAQLLKDYAALEIADDIPRDDELTFRFICDTVGDGAWVRMAGSNMSSGGHHDTSNSVYTYVYSKSATDYINDDEWGVAYRNYWGGKMGYFRGGWVDGRFVNEWRVFEKGAKFEDHPNCDIYLPDREIPLISYSTQYQYNYDEKKYDRIYTVKEITTVKKSIRYRYNETDDMWYAAVDEIAGGYASYANAKTLVENGALDASYLEKLSLTRDQVKALKVDRNTDTIPGQGYIFDGTAVPGTPFGFAYILGDVDTNGEIDAVDASFIRRVSASLDTPLAADEITHGDVDKDGRTDITDATAIQYYLADMRTAYRIGEVTKINE
ncbi:MAG: dockerin type I repeat-containing protein [Ruminococcus sp.]|nr:dockerin type I repeat-containing protein [Ruminococcus sp.]